MLGGFVLLLLTLLVLLQSSNLWKTLSVSTASDTVLLYALSSLNFIAFVIFSFILIRSLLKLRQERKALQLGSKIKTRLLVYFFAVSLLPIVAMAVFSYLFMNRALERWFSQMPENVIRAAGQLEKQSAEAERKRLAEIAGVTQVMVGGDALYPEDIATIQEAGGFAGVEYLDPSGKVISAIFPKGVDKKELDQLLILIRDRKYEAPELSDGLGYDAAVARLPEGRMLVMITPAVREIGAPRTFEESLREFDRLKSQQSNVRQIGITTLGLLTFLLIFASSWTAFYIAKGLTRPIRALAEGAKEIADGNLGYKVEVPAEDELELLVNAFNEMSAKLGENSEELSERRKYIETILQSLSTGVISFDGSNKVTTINKAALQMLRLEETDLHHTGFDKMFNPQNTQILERLLGRAKRTGQAAEQTVLRREYADGSSDSGDGLTVALTARALPDDNGAVLVIEDLSELIAAQRASAWQEVARRMAHEIKNPLTPIQLSAERIAKRLDKDLESAADTVPVSSRDDRRSTSKVVREGTSTILREVASLKTMVDEFSRFARLPDVILEPGDLNELLKQVALLYEDRAADVELRLDLAEDLPEAMLDDEQIKRVFVNLIDNSLEAFEDSDGERSIVIATRHDRGRDLVVAEVSDTGKGISPADFQRLFQPYFSTKGRGTGLGLAIVQRIVSEHGGRIRASQNQPHGAKFFIELQSVNRNGDS